MKLLNTILLLFAGLINLISCSSIPEEDAQREVELIPNYQLAVTDSFGVDVGDSLNMIGSIDGCFINSDGSIVLLDATARKIRVIQRSGEAYFFGRIGQGPEELARPQSMCLMQDGRILVSDPYKFLVMQFDISGQYLGNYLESEWKVPGNCQPIDSNSVVGIVFDVAFNNDQMEELNYYVGRFDSSPDPSVRYIELRYEFTDPAIYTQIDIMDFCVDPNGLVYIVPDHTDYLIDILSSDGTVQGQICSAVTRLSKTEEEIDAEIEEFGDNHTGDTAYRGGYEPIPYYPLIVPAGVDSDRNLWVRRLDIEDRFSFDVWDLSGNLIRTVSLERFTSNPDLKFHVSENGVLGVITESDVHPRVYRLDSLERVE